MFNHPAVEFTCRRCRKPAGHDPEVCWMCGGPLCFDCWDEYGHCGHPAADALNESARQAQDAAKDDPARS